MGDTGQMTQITHRGGVVAWIDDGMDASVDVTRAAVVIHKAVGPYVRAASLYKRGIVVIRECADGGTAREDADCSSPSSS